MIEVVKRAIPVMVQFMTSGGIIETLEGPVRYQSGDAVMTGIKGERWPMQREHFLASYQPLPPIEAAQDGAYLKRPSKIMAQRLDNPCSVSVGYANDKLEGQAGDWLLQYADGSQGIVAAEIFELTYSLC